MPLIQRYLKNSHLQQTGSLQLEKKTCNVFKHLVQYQCVLQEMFNSGFLHESSQVAKYKHVPPHATKV